MSKLSEQIVEAASEVHWLLGGPGLLENVYESALCHELAIRKIPYQRQVPVPVLYKGVRIREPLFLDILVDRELVVEIKAMEKDNPYFQIQLFTHMKLLGVKSGLLINFGKQHLKDGICRLANEPIVQL
jgi:GxxExxY protein